MHVFVWHLGVILERATHICDKHGLHVHPALQNQENPNPIKKKKKQKQKQTNKQTKTKTKKIKETIKEHNFFPQQRKPIKEFPYKMISQRKKKKNPRFMLHIHKERNETWR